MPLDESAAEPTREEVRERLKQIVDELGVSAPKIGDAAGAAVGTGAGGVASYGTLYYAGIAGLSAPGITSGLATVGALVGGGMVAGIAVLVAPPVFLGIAGYGVARKRRHARLAAALGTAIERLYVLQERLIANAEHFREELAEIRAYIEQIERQMPKASRP